MLRRKGTEDQPRPSYDAEHARQSEISGPAKTRRE
jgi:hypothetical protein